MAMYAATAFLVLEAGDIILPRIGLPDWTVTILIIVIAIGFPVTAIVSWIFDITPEGIIRTSEEIPDKKDDRLQKPKKRIFSLNNIVILILLIAVCILLYPKLFQQATTEKTLDAVNHPISQIAVLPFSNTRSDPETDYLGFAIADQIIGNLVYLQNISVRPSVVIRKYDQQTIDPIEAGKELDVKYILSGNYLKEKNTIRLNVELVDVKGNEMIWREPIEVDFTTAFALQDIVAEKVVEGLNVQFSENEFNRIRKNIPVDPLAFDYYLRSISYPFTNEGDQLAIEMLHKSIELDSGYAPAYAQLARRLHRYAIYGSLNPQVTKQSEEFYLKALSIDNELIYANSNLAQLYVETGRIEQAIMLLRQILSINPNYSEALFSLGYIYRYAGMNTESINEMEKAYSLDSNNPGFRSIVITYEYAGEYEKSLELSRRFEQSAFMIGQQGVLYLLLGRRELALEYLNRVIEMESEGADGLWAIGLKSYINGQTETGIEAMRRFEEANIDDAEAWYQFAGICGLLDDYERCIRFLQRAVDGGFFNYPHMVENTFFNSVKNEPGFLKILEQAKQKHYAFREKFFGST